MNSSRAHMQFPDAKARIANLGNVYEELIDHLSQCLMQPGQIVVDGGANIGMHTRTFAKRVSPGGFVHAFEPTPEVAARNEEILRGMGLQTAAKVHRIGLWHESGTSEFCFFPNRPGRSSLKPGSVDDAPTIINIQLARLDDVIRDDIVSFIKLDVEGAEINAIRGAEQTIRRSNCVIVFENGLQGTANQFNYSADDFFNIFNRLNYNVLDAFGNHLTQDRFHINISGWYFIALPADHHNYNKIIEIIDLFWLNRG